MSASTRAPLWAPLVVVVVASCGGLAQETPPAPDAGQASSPNPCGGEAPLTFGGSVASPGAPCGACGTGALVCADSNLLACAGALPSAACPDASVATAEAGMDGASGDATSSSDGGSDVGAGGDASDEDGGASFEAGLDGAEDSSRDGEPGDAPSDAPPFDSGPGWQPNEAGLDAETFTSDDGGVSVRCLDLPTADLVADPARSLLYASVTSTAPELGNRVVRIDPATLTVSGTVFVGSNPNALAITDDGAALYLGEDGAGSVRRVDLGSGAVEAPVYLGVENNVGQRAASEIRAVPGSATQYVVSRRVLTAGPSFSGLALYDGATLLGEWNSYIGGVTIGFTSPTVLYGYNNETSGFDLYEFDVSAAGVQMVSDETGIFTGFLTTITSQGGWVFATNGQAVNGANGQPIGAYAASGPVWPDTNGADVWFLQATPTLLDFDRDTFLLKSSFPLPAASVASGSPASLLGFSPRTFAFRTPASVCLMSVAPSP
jgi:hypothetical protein